MGIGKVSAAPSIYDSAQRDQCVMATGTQPITPLTGAQDGTDSMVAAYQQAVVSAKNVIFNGPLGADATITTTGGAQVNLQGALVLGHMYIPCKFSITASTINDGRTNALDSTLTAKTLLLSTSQCDTIAGPTRMQPQCPTRRRNYLISIASGRRP